MSNAIRSSEVESNPSTCIRISVATMEIDTASFHFNSSPKLNKRSIYGTISESYLFTAIELIITVNLDGDIWLKDQLKIMRGPGGSRQRVER